MQGEAYTEKHTDIHTLPTQRPTALKQTSFERF